MQYKHLLVLLVATSTAVSAAFSYCPPRPATPHQQKQIFQQFLKSYYADKQLLAAYATHVASDLIQHSPGVVGNGRINTTAWVAPYWDCIEWKVMRSVFADGLGVAHIWEARNYRYHTMADFYRMDGTCIVEHWDVMQDFPRDAVNPLAMLDGEPLPNVTHPIGCGFS